MDALDLFENPLLSLYLSSAPSLPTSSNPSLPTDLKMIGLLPVLALALSSVSANPIISSGNGILRELVGLQRRSDESSLNETASKPWVLAENLVRFGSLLFLFFPRKSHFSTLTDVPFSSDSQGNLSPYHVPESDYTLELPETCVVDQFVLPPRRFQPIERYRI